MISKENVSDLKRYYEKLRIGVNMSTMWNSLQRKAEYGSDRSEKGYQLVAANMAESIARELQLDPNLAAILTMCRGSFFPAYGKEGKKAIMEYLAQHNIDISEADLARTFVEHNLSSIGTLIIPDFDEKLQELFNDEIEPKTPEVQVAKVCCRTMEDVKKIEGVANIDQTNLLYRISKDVEKCSIEANYPTDSAKLKELVSSIPEKEEPTLSEEKKQKIFSVLDSFIKNSSKGELDGICEYIAIRELDR